MKEENTRAIWARVLNETSLFVRRRASDYLQNVKKISENEWLVWSDEGIRYQIRLEKERITCSCPYFQQEKGYCKHICAVAVHELTRLDVIPWLKKLEEKL